MAAAGCLETVCKEPSQTKGNIIGNGICFFNFHCIQQICIEFLCTKALWVLWSLLYNMQGSVELENVVSFMKETNGAQ